MVQPNANSLLLLLIVTLHQISYSIGENPTLLSTNVIFRHGDRAPAVPLPIDKYNESFWPYGWGELTDKGKEQQFQLGKYLRLHKYKQFLKDTFDYREIEVQSSDIDRCLISAYSNLAGLYTNDTTDRLPLPYMKWQPIPVHSVPILLDEVLAMDRPCSKSIKETSRLMNGPLIQKINKDYARLFKLISEETGLNLTENGFRDFWPAADAIHCESLHGAAVRNWTTGPVTCNGNKEIPCDGKTVWDVMEEMQDYQFYVMYNSTIMNKFDGGPLLENIVKKMEDFVSGNRTVKFNMYSAHDTTVAALLSALGVFDDKAPQYAATVLIDLYRDNTKPAQYEVKVYYKNETYGNVSHHLELPGCMAPCTLQMFRELTDKYKIRDWDFECGNTEPTTPKPDNKPVISKVEVVVISICSAVVLLLALSACICYVNRRRISQSSYSELTDR